MTIIRPRGGNFIYNKAEIEIIQDDIAQFKQLGTDGIVIGCLNDHGWIDEKAMLLLLESAEGLDITFHMAFDRIKPDNQLQAIDWLATNGVHRILTHGGPSHTSIEDNLDRLKEYIEYAGDKIIILPGGGITDKNLNMIASQLQVSEIHGTKLVGDLIKEVWPQPL